MKIDVDIDKFSGGYKIVFPLKEFNEKTDYKMAIELIRIFAADVELDPELELSDMEEIVEKTEELTKQFFTVEISAEGIEVDI